MSQGYSGSLAFPSASQRFFEEGREQLEREIELLEKRQMVADETILTIDEELLQHKPNLALEITSESDEKSPEFEVVQY